MAGGCKNPCECIKAFSETDSTEDLKKMDVPALIIQGDDDQVVPDRRFGTPAHQAHPRRPAHRVSGRAARHHRHAQGSAQRRFARVPEVVISPVRPLFRHRPGLARRWRSPCSRQRGSTSTRSGPPSTARGTKCSSWAAPICCAEACGAAVKNACRRAWRARSSRTAGSSHEKPGRRCIGPGFRRWRIDPDGD